MLMLKIKWGSSSASVAAQAQGQNPSGSMEGDDSSVVDVKAMRMMRFKKHLKGIDSSNTKSEVDKYLLESCEDVMDENFDILAWWKVNSPQYCVLSRVTQHVLAIPVSTVASKSTFSTASCVLDPFRGSLSPLMVEALICGQNWLCPSSAPISLCATIDDVKEFEKLDGGMTIIFYIKKIYEFLFLYLLNFFLHVYYYKTKTKCLGFLAYLLFYCTFCMSISFFI